MSTKNQSKGFNYGINKIMLYNLKKMAIKLWRTICMVITISLSISQVSMLENVTEYSKVPERDYTSSVNNNISGVTFSQNKSSAKDEISESESTPKFLDISTSSKRSIEENNTYLELEGTSKTSEETQSPTFATKPILGAISRNISTVGDLTKVVSITTTASTTAEANTLATSATKTKTKTTIKATTTISSTRTTTAITTETSKTTLPTTSKTSLINLSNDISVTAASKNYTTTIYDLFSTVKPAIPKTDLISSVLMANIARNSTQKTFSKITVTLSSMEYLITSTTGSSYDVKNSSQRNIKVSNQTSNNQTMFYMANNGATNLNIPNQETKRNPGKESTTVSGVIAAVTIFSVAGLFLGTYLCLKKTKRGQDFHRRVSKKRTLNTGSRKSMNDKLPDNIGPRSHLPDYLTIKYNTHKDQKIDFMSENSDDKFCVQLDLTSPKTKGYSGFYG